MLVRALPVALSLLVLFACCFSAGCMGSKNIVELWRVDYRTAVHGAYQKQIAHVLDGKLPPLSARDFSLLETGFTDTNHFLFFRLPPAEAVRWAKSSFDSPAQPWLEKVDEGFLTELELTAKESSFGMARLLRRPSRMRQPLYFSSGQGRFIVIDRADGFVVARK